MHSGTRLTCTFWVTKSVWADSAGVIDRHRNFRKWNFSYFIPSMLSQKLRTRNYAHFELFLLTWTYILAFFDIIWRFLLHIISKCWRTLIWQKISWNNNSTKFALTSKCHRNWLFRTFEVVWKYVHGLHVKKIQNFQIIDIWGLW